MISIFDVGRFGFLTFTKYMYKHLQRPDQRRHSWGGKLVCKGCSHSPTKRVQNECSQQWKTRQKLLVWDAEVRFSTSLVLWWLLPFPSSLLSLYIYIYIYISLSLSCSSSDLCSLFLPSLPFSLSSMRSILLCLKMFCCLALQPLPERSRQAPLISSQRLASLVSCGPDDANSVDWPPREA